MDEIFTKKVRGAAVAGWWTVLIAYCILLIEWLAYLLICTRHPAAMLCFVGPGVTWPEVRTIWLWGMVAYDIIVGMMLFVVIWLTLWARQQAKKFI
jgi:hypothetical protein